MGTLRFSSQKCVKSKAQINKKYITAKYHLILAYDKSQSFMYYLVTLDVKHIVIDEWDEIIL